MTEANLEQRARTLRETLQTHFIDEQGYLIYNLNRHTMKPFTKEYMKQHGCSVGHTLETPSGRWTYEDTMFNSGIYLVALTEEYLVTGDASVRAIADRVFDDIQPLIQENDDIDPGYIGKPWGGHQQKSTTIDQTWYFCFGLHRYCEMADPGRKKRAEEMILGNVDWWIKRGYRHFGHRDDVPPCWLSPSHGGGAMAAAPWRRSISDTCTQRTRSIWMNAND